MGFQGLLDPSLAFNFSSVPQVGLDNRSINVVGGVMLGGSSGINGLQVQRGQKEDYNRWSSYFGKGSTWGWNDILPYFKKVKKKHEPSSIGYHKVEIEC
jgi:choline dehydrogenase-like flavoprotein